MGRGREQGVVQEWFDVERRRLVVSDAHGAGPGPKSDVAAGGCSAVLFADDDLLIRRHPRCPSSR
jgi:hypothetical protein